MRFFTTVIFIHLLLSATGQVIINEHNFPLIQKVEYQRADKSTIPVIATDNNTIWDLSVLKPGGETRKESYNPGDRHPFFTQQNYMGTREITLGAYTFLQSRYYDVNYRGVSARGIEYDAQQVSLAGVTGNAGDFLTIPFQNSFYTESFYEVPFPLKLDVKWKPLEPSKMTTKINITAASHGFSNTPATIVSTYFTEGKVISSGYCSVPAHMGKGPAMPVLVVQTIESRYDTLLINAVPVDSAKAAQLGLPNGHAYSVFRRRFYRVNGGVQCMAIISYTDADFTQVQSAEYSTEFLTSTGREEIIPDGEVVVYPNPSNGGEVIVQTDKTDENPNFTMYDLNGKLIPLNKEPLGEGAYKLWTLLTISPGIYTLHIQTDTKFSVLRLIIQ